MSNIKDGGPAFARTAFSNSGGMVHEQDGMSLRDYFAAKAMQGSLACQATNFTYYSDHEHSILAVRAYAIADAMLNAREVTP